MGKPLSEKTKQKIRDGRLGKMLPFRLTIEIPWDPNNPAEFFKKIQEQILIDNKNFCGICDVQKLSVPHAERCSCWTWKNKRQKNPNSIFLPSDEK